MDLSDSEDRITVPFSDLRHPNDPIGLDSPTSAAAETIVRALPEFLRMEAKATLEIDGVYRRGFLNMDAANDWVFEIRAKSGAVVDSHPLPDLPYSWRNRIQEESFSPGWQTLTTFERCEGTAFFVSARGCVRPCPVHLWRALHPDFPDRDIWTMSYNEEYTGLVNEKVFRVISKAEYLELLRRTGKPAIPTMVVLIFKTNGLNNDPHRAKCRIVVLGNLEQTPWTKNDCYAPTVPQSVVRLLCSDAVGKGRIIKQADFKNAFCQPELPPDEVVVVKPPKACPRSAVDEYWLLQKTLYGLRRSPKHWYDKLAQTFHSLNLRHCPNALGTFVGYPIPDGPPLYVAAHVDDLIYYSECNLVEEYFEASLASLLRIDFLGPVEYYLGILFDWSRDGNDNLCVHLSQEAYVSYLLEQFGFDENALDTKVTPFRSGHPVDAIPRDNVLPELLKKRYQSLVGSLNWLQISTRPDLSVIYSCLASYQNAPTQGHLDAALFVLRYLGGCPDLGILYSQREASRLHSFVAWPDEPRHLHPPGLEEFSDANWGPQDATDPPKCKTCHQHIPGREMHVDECRSMLGHCLVRSGGPITWAATKESRVSRSVAESEIKATDEGSKAIQHFRHVMADLDFPEVSKPTQMLCDNKSAVDWAKSVFNKTMKYLNIRQSAVREVVKFKECVIDHIGGKDNPADLLTKEQRDNNHFLKLRSKFIVPRPFGPSRTCI